MRITEDLGRDGRDAILGREAIFGGEVSQLDDLASHFEAVPSSSLEHMDAWLTKQRIEFANRPLPTFFQPHLVRRSVEHKWASSLTSLLEIFERVGQRILDDNSLLKLLELPAGSQALLDIDPGYSKLIIGCRMDAVWDGDELSVLEVNSDSPAMMTYTDRLEQYHLEESPLRDAFHAVRAAERTRGLYDAIVRCYHEWGGTSSNPTIAIVDWKGEKTAGELIHTAIDFERFGSQTVICDPSELRIVDGALHAGRHKIDVVQRRVLFPDFIARESELKVLIEACTRGLACVVNPLRGYVLGNKLSLALLSSGQGDLDLSTDEIALVRSVLPDTLPLDQQLAERMLANRNKWVLKGAFGSGGDGVILGNVVTQETWEARIEAALGTPAVGQRCQPIPRLRLPRLNDGHVEYEALYTNWNPWFFGGQYHGASTRVSTSPLVSIQSGGGLLPCIAV